MGSYDGAEIYELVCLFILEAIAKRFGKENVGLCRDDELALLKNMTGRLGEKKSNKNFRRSWTQNYSSIQPKHHQLPRCNLQPFRRKIPPIQKAKRRPSLHQQPFQSPTIDHKENPIQPSAKESPSSPRTKHPSNVPYRFTSKPSGQQLSSWPPARWSSQRSIKPKKAAPNKYNLV